MSLWKRHPDSKRKLYKDVEVHCRENESHRTQDEQSDHQIKDVRKDQEKNYSGDRPLSVFLDEELCERGRTA